MTALGLNIWHDGAAKASGHRGLPGRGRILEWSLQRPGCWAQPGQDAAAHEVLLRIGLPESPRTGPIVPSRSANDPPRAEPLLHLCNRAMCPPERRFDPGRPAGIPSTRGRCRSRVTQGLTVPKVVQPPTPQRCFARPIERSGAGEREPSTRASRRPRSRELGRRGAGIQISRSAARRSPARIGS